MKTANEIFENIKAAAGRGHAYHIGMITKRRFQTVCNKIEIEWINAKTDYKFGILTKEQYDAEMKKLDCMVASIKTAEFI